MTLFRSHMPAALKQARAAAERGETPVGAVIVDLKTQAIIAAAGNECRARPDPCAHAELIAIQIACHSVKRERLQGMAIWVTLEPCAMCAGAIAHARLDRLYFGASDPKSGGVLHGPRVFDCATTHHRPEIIGGVMEAECAAAMQAFFSRKR